MNSKDKYSQYLNIAYTILVLMTLISALLLVIGGINGYNKSKAVIKNDKIMEYNTGWYDETGKTVKLNPFTSNEIFQDSSKAILYKKLTDVEPGDTLCFRSLSCFITMSINGKPIVTTPYKDMLFSCNSTGSVWSFYQIKEEDIGETIEMQVELCYNDSSCYIDQMYIGDLKHIMANFFSEKGFTIITTLITLFIGLLFVCTDVYVNKSKALKQHMLLHIGLFAIWMSIWCLLSSRVIELISGTSQMIQYLSCVLLYIIPTQTLLFVRSIFNVRKDTSIKVMCSIILGFYTMATILQVADIADYHETLVFTHISMVITILTIIHSLTITHLDGGIYVLKIREEKKRGGFVVITVLVFGLLFTSVLLDIFSFYSSDQTTLGKYTCFSVIFVILYLGLIAAHNMYNMVKQLNENEISTKLLNVDSLTNLKNRNAFVSTLDELNKDLKGHEKVGIITFDILELKKTNDEYGHNVGDRLLSEMALLLDKAFSNEFSEVFRIGGDEFAVIIDCKEANKLYNIGMYTFNESVAAYNSVDVNAPLNLSIGCAYYDPSKDVDSIYDIAKTSENQMKKNKTRARNKKKTK